jgi:SOS response regulatory protein OraA/RecX
LISKGVSESITNKAITEEGGWRKAAKRVFVKKFKNGKNSDAKDILKQKTFLQNRGFGFKEIESVFSDDML